MNYEYCDGMTHTIKKGDTLYEISRAHNVPLSLLLRANPYVDVFNLQVGDTLCIPTKKPPERPFPMPGVSPGMRPRDGMEMPGTMDSERLDEDPFERAPAFDDAEPPVNTERQNERTAPRTENQSQSDNPRRVNIPPRIDPQTERIMESQDTSKSSSKEDSQAVSKEPEREKMVETNERRWEKYVVKPGDTLGDLLQGTDVDVEDFVEKNGINTIYMLPGAAYYVPVK